MSHNADILLKELRTLIRDLGKDGGQMSPSVYDTVQVLRHAPPREGVEPALVWVKSQQREDGGWGNPAAPLSRDVPTLAAILALHHYDKSEERQESVQAGLAFLRQQAGQWCGTLPDDIPIAAELILPKLLREATVAGLELPSEPYANLVKLGTRRRRLIAKMKPGAGTTAVHSWETWGGEPTPDLLDGAGSVGHSPAATAAWLQATEGHEDIAEARAAAQRYLEQAAAATSLGIPGVVPTAWPITRCEQAFALHALLVSGLLNYTALKDVVRSKIDALANALRPDGIGMSDFFIPDGDDTTAAIAVLHASGYQVDPKIVKTFQQGDYLLTYPGELHPSILPTARAVYGRAMPNEQAIRSQAFIAQRRHADGRWPADKWHGSWQYTTMEVTLALISLGQDNDVKTTADAWLAHQYENGGWGANCRPTPMETAYGVLALRVLRDHNLLDPNGQNALKRAYCWLLQRYRPFDAHKNRRWIGKELYSLERVDRVFELSAMLAMSLEGNR